MAARAAVVVGINYTADPPTPTQIPELKFAEADAQAITDRLKQAGYDVVCLLGAAASERAIRRALVQAARAAGEAGLCVIYFSGHGLLDPTNPQRAYLAPADVEPDAPAVTAIALNDLTGSFLGEAARALVLLDCCYSGVATSLRGRAFADVVQTSFEGARGKVVLAASAADHQTREMPPPIGHGIFTHFLLQHWDAGGEVTDGSLYEHAAREMARQGYPPPARGGPLVGRLVLREGPDPASKAAEATGFTAPPFCVPYDPNPLFVGHAAEIGKLDDLLAQGQAPALIGTGGLGKTQLAVQYAYHARARYPGGIFWLAMEQSAGVPTQVAALTGPEGLNLPGAAALSFDDKIAAVRRAWQEPLARLLIFDNLEDPVLLRGWKPKGGGTQVLVTSRYANWTATSGLTPLPLQPLKRPFSVELLLAPRARQRGAAVPDLLADPALAADADAICEAVGDLPLALALAGAYLESTPSATFARLRARLEQAPTVDPALNPVLAEGLPTGHAPSVVATFALSYDRLDLADPVDELALRLLGCAAQCASAPIPPQLLLRAISLATPTVGTEQEIDSALRQLAALGLIEILPDSTLRLHRLLGAYVRSRQLPQVNSPWKALWECLRTIFTHQRAPASDNCVSALAEALVQEVNIINEAGYPLKGQPYLEHLWHTIAGIGSHTDASTAALQSALGELLYMLGNFTAAFPCWEQALIIRTRIFGEVHPITASSLHNMAELLYAQGDYAKARPFFEQAVRIRQQTLGERHPDTAKSLNSLAMLVNDQGDFNRARTLLTEALTIREQICGEMHLGTAESLNDLAKLEEAQENYVDARRLYERALAIRKYLLGDLHPVTATTLNNLATLLKAQGDLDAAFLLLQQAYAHYRQTLGPDHPDTVVSLGNLAMLLHAKGDLEAARPLLDEALTICQQSLGPTHPATATSLNNLAALLSDQGDLDGARSLVERALAIHQQIHGPMHTETATSLYNLALILQAQGDQTTARRLLEQALLIREHALGPTHPATARIRNDLELLLEEHGEL
jgi:tetratricopeptide (TPR) repeat protein